MMGRVSACTPLLGWKGPAPQTTLSQQVLAWNGKLSEGQKIASEEVVEAVQQNEELLVWAVCGAGKTEVLFQGIESALTAGKRVCIATPRTDVVLELTPRLKAAFPGITVASLYGGSEDRHLYAPLTIATTHQLLRFYQAFDTVILDEVDAFPYTVEESLQYAAAQARKPISSIIYLTATPNEKWQLECRQGKRHFTTIPARFHRHPLPVPEFSWCGNWQKLLKKDKLPANILKWIKARLQSGKQALIFFPHIPLMEKTLPLLRTLDPKIEAVHAEDPDRKEKVQQMRRRELALLLTTTILERGVTFPNIDVAVIGAEDTIFTESALVQIAGRAGRSAEHPTGNVTFFHYGKTEAMLKARKQIVTMNREGVKRGLIDK
jgi:competence protein ComFA